MRDGFSKNLESQAIVRDPEQSTQYGCIFRVDQTLGGWSLVLRA